MLSGLAPNYRTFLVLRMLFGIGMGGEWGVGASLALESASPRLRGLLSGLLQEGYAIGNLLAALAFRTDLSVVQRAVSRQRLARHVFPRRAAGAALAFHPRERQGVRSLARAPHGLDDATGRSLPKHWRRFAYLVLLMTMMNFISHGTQDMYPTLLQNSGFTPSAGRRHHDAVDDRRDSRRAGVRLLLRPWRPPARDDDRAMLCALVVIPFWIAGHSPCAHRSSACS